jgi:hypothetical protein
VSAAGAYPRRVFLKGKLLALMVNNRSALKKLAKGKHFGLFVTMSFLTALTPDRSGGGCRKQKQPRKHKK